MGLKGGDKNERLTVFSESACFSIERDSLLEVLSWSDILEWQYRPRNDYHGGANARGEHSGLHIRIV